MQAISAHIKGRLDIPVLDFLLTDKVLSNLSAQHIGEVTKSKGLNQGYSICIAAKYHVAKITLAIWETYISINIGNTQVDVIKDILIAWVKCILEYYKRAIKFMLSDLSARECLTEMCGGMGFECEYSDSLEEIEQKAGLAEWDISSVELEPFDLKFKTNWYQFDNKIDMHKLMSNLLTCEEFAFVYDNTITTLVRIVHRGGSKFSIYPGGKMQYSISDKQNDIRAVNILLNMCRECLLKAR